MRAEPATQADVESWMEIVVEVEPLFGPMPDFAAHALRAISRDTALVVRGPQDEVLGAALLNADPDEHHIRWLSVRSTARRRGVARALLEEVLRRWPAPGDIAVISFGPDNPAGAPARVLYESFGFRAAEFVSAGPEGGSRQRLVLTRSGSSAPKPSL